jgi:outer membrane protein assembly factor BamB
MRIKNKLGLIILVLSLSLFVISCNQQNHRLNLVSNTGRGEVEVVSEQDQYQYGTEVVISARAAEGWSFSSWGGSLTGTDNPKSVTIESNLDIKANFIKTRSMAGGDLQNRGIYYGKEIKKNVNLEWESQGDYQVSSSPLVMGDTVYIGSKDKNLYALNKKTGQERWSFASNSEVISTPVIEEQTVLFGTTARGLEAGEFHAIYLQTGEEIWHLKTEGAIYYSSPKIKNGIVYFGDKRGYLYAIDAKTSKLNWKFKAASSIMYSAPAITEEQVVVGTVNGELYAIDRATGQQNWLAKRDHPIVSAPIVDQDTIYYVSYRDKNGILVAVDLEDGTKKWQMKFEGPIPYSIALKDNKIYLGSLEGKLYAIDIENQEQEWSFETPGEIIAPPIVTESMIYFGDAGGNVYGLDKERGREEWTFAARDTIVSAPVLAEDGRLYFSDQSGYLYCLSEEKN